MKRFTISMVIITTLLTIVCAEAVVAKQDRDQRKSEQAITGLDVASDLEVSLFASEPLMFSPSNMDVDHLGRVWICEVVNYRHFRNRNNPPREAGDRILILEDTDGDGRADQTTTFYQGRDIDSAHGLCILGNKVIVSVGDSVLVMTDEDGDLRADKKEVLFSGISGTQHDHGIHAFVFGPDGKLYFNFGNQGKQIKDKDGRPIVDLAGNEVNDRRQPYQQGMVFRCNLDGSNLETLGWNFRNNWEVCVDSFGTMWQSDNDDDGNRGVRINFVMEYGNYGYLDELTGAGWRTPRTGMAKEVPQRHWHLNDPGVVPNLLQTGAGSPTGMCIYEGTLLPQRFRNQMIHCDAGPNIVRSYPVQPQGAGYTAGIEKVLEGTRDRWFRPSDVCVAPDGSLLIADWYDPGVGGHAMGDIQRGRIFRVAPPSTPMTVPKFDLERPAGAAKALTSPNVATRYLAWMALKKMGVEAEPALLRLWRSDNARYRARAFWLLANIEGKEAKYIDAALSDSNTDIRIAGIRRARQSNHVSSLEVVQRLCEDASAAVRRECLIAIRELDATETTKLWANLAKLHDGQDRWYLEALGLAADGTWDEKLNAWLEMGGDMETPAGRDIVWRSRATATPELLAQWVLSGDSDGESLARYFRAIDFQNKTEARKVLAKLALACHESEEERRKWITSESLARLDKQTLVNTPELQKAIDACLERVAGTPAFVDLVDRFELTQRYPAVLSLAQRHPNVKLGVDAMRMLTRQQQWELIENGLRSDDQEVALGTAKAIGSSPHGKTVKMLLNVIADRDMPLNVRRLSVRSASKLPNVAARLADLHVRGTFDVDLTDTLAASLHSSRSADIKKKANALFPLPATKGETALPSMTELVRRRGDRGRGELVFQKAGTCAKCHQVNGKGVDIGPDLSEIGSKLSRQAMYESVLYPSAGISHNYETFTALLDSGVVVNGLKTSETDESISLKDAEGIERTFGKDEIEEIAESKISLMPADLLQSMTTQELVDVVEFMVHLKKK